MVDTRSAWGKTESLRRLGPGLGGSRRRALSLALLPWAAVARILHSVLVGALVRRVLLPAGTSPVQATTAEVMELLAVLVLALEAEVPLVASALASGIRAKEYNLLVGVLLLAVASIAGA